MATVLLPPSSIDLSTLKLACCVKKSKIIGFVACMGSKQRMREVD